MPTCDQCGNNYNTPLLVTYKQRQYAFDSFECAIQRLAPACAHCGCRIIGHGVEEVDRYFCCAHCARIWNQSAASTAPAAHS